MDVKEAIKAIGDKIEKNADYYSKTLKNDSIIKIEEGFRFFVRFKKMYHQV